MLDRDSQHYGRRKQTARPISLHGLFEVYQGLLIDIRDFRPDRQLVGRYIVEEVRVSFLHKSCTESCQPKEWELPIRIIAAKTDDTLTEQVPK